jgi:Ca2+-transporting ATPase
MLPQEEKGTIVSPGEGSQPAAWHALPAERVYRTLDSGPGGLNAAEAAQRLLRLGPNELQAERRESALAIFAKQFANFLILLLFGAGLVSLLLGEILDAVVILAIVLLSGALGFVQEYRASKALDALKRLAAPIATVIRDGEEARVPARELVPGDVVLVAAGDRVAADLRVVEAHNLKVLESSLTGESEPVDKSVAPVSPDTALADRTSILFASTTVVYGRGTGVVIATGMATEFGKIAYLVQVPRHEETPLEAEMDVIGRRLGLVGVAVVIAVIALGLTRGEPLLPTLLAGISLAVAAVPEALPAVVTGALTIGVQRMARRNAIVRHLPAVETLGSTTIICTDKTGTLTAGEMTVRRVALADRSLVVTGSGYGRAGEIRAGEIALTARDQALRPLLQAGALCNDASVRYDGASGRESSSEITGDPTEAALLVLAEKAGVRTAELRLEMPRIDEVPFTSARKRMTTAHELPSGPGGATDRARVLVVSKGAPEVLLRHCVSERVGGESRPLDEAARRRWLAASDELASGALRVLGKYLDEQKPRDVFFLEQDGSFVLRLLMSGQAGSRHVLFEFTREDVERMIADGPARRKRDAAGSGSGRG